ncbi:MAG TPA: hypothetical protein VJH68_04320 [Candidatus Nanoarchaeia archaeon]|nr:hypothetical protein [Candidatus Nanoarchaeia archaeon]
MNGETEERKGELEELSAEELTEIRTIKYKETCCQSYLTPKGRCYTCPENRDKDPDEEEC